MRKMSPIMRRRLRWLSRQPDGCCIEITDTTWRALKRRGMVVPFDTGGISWRWCITDAGRAAL